MPKAKNEAERENPAEGEAAAGGGGGGNDDKAAVALDTGAAGADEIRLLARTYQYDRYVTALLMPRRHREPLVVLAAYAAELCRIPQRTSEPMMAAVRLQWWRDELAAAAPRAARQRGQASQPQRRTGHLLLDALISVAATYRLPFGLLQGMIDAAETELDPAPFAEQAECRQILIKAEAAQFELAGKVLGAEEVPRTVWTDAGVAYGAARLASEFEWRQRTGAQTYVALDTLCGPKAQPAHRAAVSHYEMAIPALEASQRHFRKLGRPARGALLPLAAVSPLLRSVAMSLQQSDEIRSSVAGTGAISDFRRASAVLWAHWRQRI